jgi:hypothetical protein
MPRYPLIDVTNPKTVREVIERLSRGRKNTIRVDYVKAKPGMSRSYIEEVKYRVKGTRDTGPLKVETTDGRKLVVHDATEDVTGTWTSRDVEDMPETEEAMWAIIDAGGP